VHKVDEEHYRVYRVPIIELTKKELGRMILVSAVSLGAMLELTKCVEIDSMIGAIKKKVPKGTEEINIKAFNLGRKSVEEFITEKSHK
jgi:2-oxoglutarate ferredoxin oxidoreductase subunit gamma